MMIRVARVGSYNVNVGPKTPKMSVMLADKMLMHISKQKVIDTLKRAGISYHDDMKDCEACIQGKQHRASYRSKPEDTLARSKGYCHADLCSPPVPSLGGAKHFLCITDEYSKYRSIYLLKAKSDTMSAI